MRDTSERGTMAKQKNTVPLMWLLRIAGISVVISSTIIAPVIFKLVLEASSSIVASSSEVEFRNVSNVPVIVPIKELGAKHGDIEIEISNDTLLYDNVLSSSYYSIIINLHGEMGNHLSLVAYGYGLHWMLQEDYNVSTKLLFRHQPDRSGKYPRRWSNRRGIVSLQKCFPYFRYRISYKNNFALAESNLYEKRKMQQAGWLGERRNHELQTDPDCQDEACIRRKLLAFVAAIEERQLGDNVTINTRNHNIDKEKTISLPFFTATTYASLGYINDRYYERLKLLFRFDFQSPECCSAKEEEELIPSTILHVRGFLHELPRVGYRLGYEELSANKTAYHLFQNTTNRITVMGRFANSTLPYVTALQQNGFDAVFHDNKDGTNAGEQSFCYLLSVPREIVGISMSSFLVWAAYLGNATRARLYSVRSPAREAQFPNGTYFFHYNFTLSSWLKEKMVFELYTSEEQDDNNVSR